MKKLVIIAVLGFVAYYLYMQFFIVDGMLIQAGAGSRGSETRQMRKLMKVCMNETSKFCTADAGLEGVIDCLEDHEADLSAACRKEFDKLYE